MIALIIILSLAAFVIAFVLSFPLWAIFWGAWYRHKRHKRLACEAQAAAQHPRGDFDEMAP